MIQVQRWAVMRPNEVCRMRVENIDMSRKDGVWLYRPPKHKGTWRGHGKAVPFGKPEQALMAPYLEGKTPDRAVFSPKTTKAEKEEQFVQAKLEKGIKHVKRIRWKKEAISKEPQEHYSSRTYARAIERAIKQANRNLPPDQQIPHWTPYQLRHSGITELVFENDGNAEIARAVAGQRTISVTQGYNHADLDIAIEQAKKRESKKKR
jgi:integrase